jgi:fido (protein-threonine AMPylation protein)
VSDDDDNDRHSEFLGSTPWATLTEGQRADVEAANALRQTDKTLELIGKALAGSFRLRPSDIQELNRVALRQVEKDAGRWRDGPIRIGKSAHVPPPAEEVPGHIDDMCEYVNDNWNKGGIHLAAYIMWRLNWIHPFVDGNGRTTRAISYLVLSKGLGFYFPGVSTIPEIIARNKDPYYKALDEADAALNKGRVDVSEMEALLKNALASQFFEAIEKRGEEPSQEKTHAALRAHTSRGDDKAMTTRSQPDSESDRLTLRAALVFGGATFLFLMALIVVEILQRPVPKSAHWLVVLFFAFSGGLTAALWRGKTSVRGTFQVPVLGDKNVRFKASDGIAVVIILLVLGKLLFL